MEENKNSILKFPENFIFGTSVASFQVEGNVTGTRKTDWDIFFEENADQIIRPGEVGPNWWGSFENIEKDISAISQLGVNMQRLSFEWERIEPSEGEIDREAIKKYRQIIELLDKYGLEPMVTINHFTLPSWISKKGGWTNPETIERLKKYSLLLINEFPQIKNWVILNEPGYLTYLGNFMGVFPPNKKSILSTILTRNNIIKAQKEIYSLIKEYLPNAFVGNAFSLLWLRSNDANSNIEKFLARASNFILNTNFINATKNYADYIGINYYTGYYIDLKLNYFSTTFRNEASYVPHHLPFGKTVRPKTYKSDMGWPIVPDFFLDVLKHLYKQYKKPIFITENGIADRDDIYRPFYILTHLAALAKAVGEGVDVRGYIHWATIDNLEWVEGYAKRFGLISVDSLTGERKTRKSAEIFKEIISKKEVSKNLIRNFIPEEQQQYASQVIDQLLRSNKDLCPRISKSL